VSESAGRDLFRELAQTPDSQLDLALGALLIAEEEYPELDRGRYLARLDELGAEARTRRASAGNAAERVQLLAQLLAWDHGFHGNRDDYSDPRNSFLNDVLDRRTGIPITLSVLYIEVGRRAGIDVQGVGFPAHFLARHEDVIFDPFSEGRMLSIDDCRELLQRTAKGRIAFRPEMLEPTPPRAILVRMLNNLKHIYVRARYYRKAIGIIDRLLMLQPDAYEELRDRGAIRAELKQFALARADLAAYVERCTQPERALEAKQAISNIDRLTALIDD
jgi:regulator of sirC expression with transglutaminase-like and TPR domain